MEGIYRVRYGPQDLMESFVAAPGPMGWRYFGRVYAEDAGRELYTVDHVVDINWNLVRFRTTTEDGTEAIASPSSRGLEVWTRGVGQDRTEVAPEASAVWSASPSSLLVLERLARTHRRSVVSAVWLEPPFRPQRVTVRLERLGSRRIRSAGRESVAEEIDVVVDGRTIPALIRSDLPLSAEGWFELVA